MLLDLDIYLIIEDYIFIILYLLQILHNGEYGVHGKAVLSLVMEDQNKEVEHAMVMGVFGTAKNHVCALLQPVQVRTS